MYENSIEVVPLPFRRWMLAQPPLLVYYVNGIHIMFTISNNIIWFKIVSSGIMVLIVMELFCWRTV